MQPLQVSDKPNYHHGIEEQELLGNHQFSLLCPFWYVQKGFFWQQWNTELWKTESTSTKIWWWDFRLWWLCLPLPLCLTLLDTAQHSQFFAKLPLNKLSLHKQPHFHSTYGFENSLYPLGSCDAEQKLWPELWYMAESSVNPKFVCFYLIAKCHISDIWWGFTSANAQHVTVTDWGHADCVLLTLTTTTANKTLGVFVLQMHSVFFSNIFVQNIFFHFPQALYIQRL